jgi:hypothetical protein
MQRQRENRPNEIVFILAGVPRLISSWKAELIYILLERLNQAVEFPTSISKRCRLPRSEILRVFLGAQTKVEGDEVESQFELSPEPILDDLLLHCLNIQEQRLFLV